MRPFVPGTRLDLFYRLTVCAFINMIYVWWELNRCNVDILLSSGIRGSESSIHAYLLLDNMIQQGTELETFTY